MPRSKPRYPHQLDNAFCELAEHYHCETFRFETWIMACVCTYLRRRVDAKADTEALERIATKIGLEFTELPRLVVAVQEELT